MTQANTLSQKILITLACFLCSVSHAQSAVPLIEIAADTNSLPNLNVKGFTLINQSSHTLLAHQNDHVQMPPASLTKLMTLFIAYDYVNKGLIDFNEPVFISQKAWKTEGSRMFIEPNSHVKLRELLRGISIVSGNDASIAVAEHIAGDEKTFVDLMNQKAQELNLQNTHFENSTGLPHPKHFSTPYDMSILAHRLITQHPQVLEHTKEKTMTYKKITQNNRNQLLWSDDSVFGLKTGHTQEAGYCLVAAARRNNQTIIATVFGAASEKTRNNAVKKLLNHAEHGFENITIVDDKKIPETRVWYGQQAKIQPKLQSQVQLSIPSHLKSKLHSEIKLTKALKAPLKQGEVIGSYEIYNGDTILQKTNLISETEIKPQSVWRQIIEWVHFQLYYLSTYLMGQN